VVSQDKNIASSVVNIVYNVGSKHETPERTGFAHLFEHLMFEGSEDIANFDEPLQEVGGNNNAFTSTDITNYYIHLPAHALDTALWLESNRLKGLAFSEEKLRVQKGVVIEEFNQNYINQPYGDLFHELRSMCFSKHGYAWPTIGKTPQHVEDATLEEVKAFFYAHYTPSNACLVVVGPQSPEEVLNRVKYWFEDVERKQDGAYTPWEEKDASLSREKTVVKKAPLSLSLMAFPTPSCFDPNYPLLELFADIMGGGKSSRIHRKLVDEGSLTDGFVGLTHETDSGLAYIPLFFGQLNEPKAVEKAFAVLWESSLKDGSEEMEAEWEKAKNQWLLDWEMLFLNPVKKAQWLAKAALFGKVDLLNTLPETVKRSTWSSAQPYIQEIFQLANSKVLHYLKEEDQQ